MYVIRIFVWSLYITSSEACIFHTDKRQWASVSGTDGLNNPRNQRFWKAQIYHLLRSTSSRKNARMWFWWWVIDSTPAAQWPTKLSDSAGSWLVLSCTRRGRSITYWFCSLITAVTISLRSQYFCWHTWFQIAQDWYALRLIYIYFWVPPESNHVI